MSVLVVAEHDNRALKPATLHTMTAAAEIAKTAGSGKAQLDGLSPGAWEARVWHPRMRGEPEKTAKALTIAAGELAQVAFVVSLKSEWRVPRRIDPYRGSPGN